MEEFLPSYAISKTDKYMEIGAQLLTKDGRKIGNAVVIHIADTKYGAVAHIVTDFGNTSRLIQKELEELFHQPKYIVNIEEHTGYIAMRLKIEKEGELF